MKRPLTLLVVFTLLTSALQAQIYVKHDASGANDGSSWDNAFTTLGPALAGSMPGDQNWVAAGTYKPNVTVDSLAPESFFTFPHDLELYGGFVGTETLLSERDWQANETILSGDHNGDDIDDNFDDNKADNSMHVMWLTDTVTVASVIDGLTFRNGITQAASGSGNFRRGGGLLTYDAPAIRNCRFTQNYGYFGGGLYPRIGGATGVIIENCTFDNNRGGFGAGIYINARTGELTNCTFTANVSEGSRGGGAHNASSASSYVDCTFTSNSAPMSSGGGLQVRNDEAPHITVNVMNCSFSGNDAMFGGGLGSYDQFTTTAVVNCTFEDNSSSSVGGGISNAFGAETTLTDCLLSDNSATNSGGALYSQNDSARIVITNTVMSLNSADTGAGIAITSDNESGSTIPVPMLTLENSILSSNSALDQGGGINMSNGNLNVSNCLFDSNEAFATGTGIGGGFSLNTSDSIQNTFNIINTTIVNNSAAIGGGIAHWQQATGTSELTLQNTILVNPAGIDYEVEAGFPIVISGGGNLSSDISMDTILTGTNDLTNTDPLFVDLNGDYHLTNESPCIDMGIAMGAPILDLDGLARVDDVDMGAYENQKIIIRVDDLNKSFGQLDIFPNPVADVLHYSFESNWKGSLTVEITSIDGKAVFSQKVEKTGDVFTHDLDLSDLPQGLYSLNLSHGKFVHSKNFVK